MLDQDVFKKGISELMLAFNMELTPDQIKLWYKYCKNLKNAEFKKKVENCILTCRHKPFIADLLNLLNLQNAEFNPANAGAYEVI